MSPHTYLCVNSNLNLTQLVSPSVALPAKLVLNFHQNWVSNRCDIANIDFLWVVGWGVCKVIFVSNPTKVMLVGDELWMSFGFDNSKQKYTRKNK